MNDVFYLFISFIFFTPFLNVYLFITKSKRNEHFLYWNRKENLLSISYVFANILE